VAGLAARTRPRVFGRVRSRLGCAGHILVTAMVWPSRVSGAFAGVVALLASFHTSFLINSVRSTHACRALRDYGDIPHERRFQAP
jgi:hypothetical protein